MSSQQGHTRSGAGLLAETRISRSNGDRHQNSTLTVSNGDELIMSVSRVDPAEGPRYRWADAAATRWRAGEVTQLARGYGRNSQIYELSTLVSHESQPDAFSAVSGRGSSPSQP